LNAASGTLTWSYATGNFIDSSPSVSGSLVYVGSDDGKVYAFGSTNHGTISIMLEAGWNLMSPPIVPDDTNIATILTPIRSKVVTVWSYSAASKTWIFFKPPAAGSLKTLQDGVGYWVFMTAPAVLNVTGSVIPAAQSPPSYPLVAGWNLVGFKPEPTMRNETVSQYLTSISGSYDQNNVWIYENTNDNWIRANGSTWLVPGQAMWILMTTSATLKP
jgi:hypothetical protein